MYRSAGRRGVMLERSPKSKPAAERQRAYRKRVKASCVVVPVEVDAAIVDLLVRLRWLREREAGDRGKIGQAISALLRAAR